MTRRARPVVALAALLALPACPSDPPQPSTLWLGPGATELEVQLLDHEPDPF